MKQYKKLMQKCINLAKKGIGKAEPNPYVGAIVYDEKENKIISSGFHAKFGSNHAEVNAINNARGNTKDKTIIVNLEPCCHFGKTPPCADLIIKSGFKKVVIAQYDVNPKVQKKGIEKLKKAGIEVIEGVLEKEAKELNKVFEKNVVKNKPYVVLKTATTLDSKIALANKKSKWITSEKSREFVQKMRYNFARQNGAIMSASGTILNDNPKLNIRYKKTNLKLTRIIFDPNNKIPLDYNVFNNDGARIILINNKIKSYPNYIENIFFDNDFDKLFKTLYKMGIFSIMVEAGCAFNTLLLKNKEVDEIYQFIAPKIFGGGYNFIDGLDFDEINEAISIKDMKIKKIDTDFLLSGKIIYNK